MTRRMMHRGIMTAMALAVALQVGTAFAQKPDAECQAEIDKLCPGMKPGDGVYGQCLVDHEKDFSAPCKKYSQAAAARKADLKTLPACTADAERLCKSKHSLTLIMKCLRLHQTDISSECRSEMSKRTGKY